MADYNGIVDTRINPSSPLVSELMYHVRDNPIAMSEGSPDAPVLSSGWHPYDATLAEDGATGEVYAFATDGAVASIETPILEDGYEYRLAANGLSSSVLGSDLILSMYKSTSAVYVISSTTVFSAMAVGATVQLDIDLRLPRLQAKSHFSRVMASHELGGAFQELVVSDGVGFHATPQKVSKVKLSLTSGNFDAGAVYLLRRKEYFTK